jgi:hypothetical protein
MPINSRSFERADWVVIATGAVSLIALFLPWWGVTIAGYNATVSGWNTSYGWFGGLLVFVAAGWYALARAGATMPRVPGSHLASAAAATIAGLVIIVLRWITLPRGGFLGQTFRYGGRAGIWVAVVAALVQAATLVSLYRRSGEPLPWRHGGGWR